VGVEAMIHKVAIIGAGPAGIAAAIQLQRSGITPLVFEQTRIGGLLNNAFFVENYPGFPDGISGHELVAKFRKHLRKWKISILNERVTNLVKKKNTFFIMARKQYCADKVIIASGTAPKRPKIWFENSHKKVVFEVYPIKNVRKKKIVIIGAGDAAYDYALNLCRHNEVLILNRSIKKRGLELLIERAKQADNITYIQNVRIQEITQTGEQLIAIVSHNAKRYSISADYIIYAIGRQPAIDFLSASIKKKFPRGGRNLFFVGDVKQGDLRQTSIAVGDGIKVAMRIIQVYRRNGVTENRIM
jgi:thioredoxin reductase